MPPPDALDRVARTIYRGMGYTAPWGCHPDRVLKMRTIAEMVLAELRRKPHPKSKVLKPTRQ